MNTYYAYSVVAALLIILVVLSVMMARYRRQRAFDPVSFLERWKTLQKLCARKETWGQAIIDADALLDEVLKKKHFKGKTEGERLTKAQRLFKNNEYVWFGHKLRVRVEHEPNIKLRETDVKQALVGIRQALKDLGALPDGQ